MNIEIGNCPCSWGVWYGDGGPSYVEYETFLKEVSEIGYTTIELGPVGYLPQDTSILNDLLQKYKLKICAGTICTPFNEFDSIEQYKPTLDIQLKILEHFKCEYLVAMDFTDVGRGGILKKAWTNDTYNDYFKKISDLKNYTIDEYGITTVWHQHLGTAIETREEVLNMIDATDVDLCLDTGHYEVVNGNPVKHDSTVLNFLREHKNRIKYLHFKNVDKNVMEKMRRVSLTMTEAFEEGVMCDLEDGIVDFVELRNVLEDIGYNGYGIVEQDIINKPQGYAFEKAKDNYRYLERIGY